MNSEEVSPGDPCGACEDGIAACDGVDEVRCVGAVEPNECGGCDPLPAQTGEECGPCGEGTYECNGEGGIECVGAGETNSCGGCDELGDEPNDTCEEGAEQGVVGCTGPNETRCVFDGENACGGDVTETLDGEPGTSCGTCDEGVFACDSDTETTCVGEDAGTNECGGCEQLPAFVGHHCGACDGEFVCVEGTDNEVTCEGGATNVCGGCENLDAFPGESCEGGDGAWLCDTPDSLRCNLDEDPADTNACGGTDSLDADPGAACGPCQGGAYVCTSIDQLGCVGASGSNACGGCDFLEGQPGEECGEDGTWACDGEDAVVCAEANACGGDEELEGQPGEPCYGADGTATSPTGVWECDGEDDVVCDEEVNACGGDEDLSEDPGTLCTGEEGAGENQGEGGEHCDEIRVCDGENDVVCEEVENECGGCSYIPNEDNLGEECADGDGEWKCDGEYDLTCECSQPGMEYDSSDEECAYPHDPDGFGFYEFSGAVSITTRLSNVDELLDPGEMTTWHIAGYTEDSEGEIIDAFHIEGESHSSSDTSVVTVEKVDDGEVEITAQNVDSYTEAQIEVEAWGTTDQATVRVRDPGPDWEWYIEENPFAGHNLKDVLAFDPDDVWVFGGPTGDNTAVAGHYDGEGWTRVDAPVDDTLVDAWGADPDDIWAIGSEGSLIHHDGDDWEEHTSPLGDEPQLRRIWGADSDNIWAIGSEEISFEEHAAVIHYDGSEWKSFDPPIDEPYAELSTVWGTAADDVWILGENEDFDWTLYRHDGSDWSAEVIPDSETPSDRPGSIDVWGTDENNVWFAHGEILHYDGEEWTGSYDQDAWVWGRSTGVWGNSTDDVWTTGGLSEVVNHYDGEEWTTWRLPGQSPSPSAIDGTAADDIWIVDGQSISHYDGDRWERQFDVTDDNIESLWGASADDVWASGRWVGELPHFDGDQWMLEPSEMPIEDEDVDFGVSLWGDASDYIWGVREHSISDLAFYDGDTWQSEDPPVQPPGGFHDIWGTGSDHIVAAGGGAVIRYDGEEWTEMTTALPGIPRGIWTSGSDNIWVVGADGSGWAAGPLLIHYDGEVWDTVDTPEDARGLHAIWGDGPNALWAVGDNGTTLGYDGNEWATIENPAPWTSNLIDIDGTGSDDIWAVGNDGEIIRYDGDDWTPVVSPTSINLNTIWIDPETDEIFIGGDNGLLMRGERD